MKITHIALYTANLEELKRFYTEKLGAKAGELYHNPKTGLKTYFLSFDNDVKLEIMTRPEVEGAPRELNAGGFIHMALSVGGKKNVDAITAKLKESGVPVISSPRVTGDGYYESIVLDPDANQIEIVE